ncbi:MAG: hypothetical protein II098_05990 [Treponema sp.]|nr:hypothetical protein [Treponema sp.]
MGLQPIDLSTMYSQMSNVANQVAHGEQGVQLAKSMQQVDVVKLNSEQSKKVHQAGEDSKSSAVDQNGSNGQQFAGGKKGSKEENQSEEQNSNDKYRLKESYLGLHIDITR